jgi:hypothetical protein
LIIPHIGGVHLISTRIPTRGRWSRNSEGARLDDMTQIIINVLIAVVVIAWIGGRQLTWRPVTPQALWTLPAIITGAGVVLTASQVKPAAFTPFAVGVLAAEIVLSVGLGVLMGAIARFRRDAAVPGRQASEWETRTGWLGMALWVVLIGLRVGMDVWADAAGAGELLVATGTIVLVVGINRLTRSAVIAYRLSRHALVAA